MELTIYDIIQKPVITDKTAKLAKTLNKVVIQVHPQANKPMIADALEKLFNVKVRDIRIVVRKGKIRTFKRMKTQGKLTKRAIVTLKPGYSFDAAAPNAAPAEVVNK